QMLPGLARLDPRARESLEEEQTQLEALLKKELDARIAALRKHEPKPRALKPVGRLSPGTLTQVAVGEVLRKLLGRWETPQGQTPHQLGFLLFESEREAALDMVGGDFVLVSKTGQFMLLDATCSAEKGHDTGVVPLLRQQGT